ncbi:hypothetical protein [Ferruginibacter sp. HRS2-29]|uniref:hypothetical protein n=1 Tax=Ferruginibacter sp. HRS2-29 TaxID=2487334 RepID=UPI0020CD8327|nr:hypothetical protein [Ferruginibacter sp. HRS2-29]
MKQFTQVIYVMVVLMLLSGCAGRKNESTGEIVTEDQPAETVPDFRVAGLVDLNEKQDMKEILCQSWNNKEDADDIKNSRGDSELEMANRGYCFFNDGTMVKDPRGEYRLGVWMLHDDKKPYLIEMKLDNGTKELHQVARLDPKNLTLNEVTSGNEKKLVEYKGEAVAHLQIRDEPFHITNNRWRIAPKQPETDEAIKARLKASIHFFVLFYDHCINARSEDVILTGLPSCFKWYAGGIYMRKEKDLPANWISCFYNAKQAAIAYKMADELLDRKYNWPKGERNWVKQNVFVLKQMEKQL